MRDPLIGVRTRKIAATVLAGFLGAGKTTALNHLLGRESGERTAVIVNEFGEIGIDGQLILGTADRVVEISNGCVFCAVRGDLIEALRDLLESGSEVDRLIIETSGLADPAPVIQSFLLDELLVRRVALDAIVTVVDVLHPAGQLDQDEAKEQISFADVILLNKTDLVTEDALAASERRVRGLNPLARIPRTRNGAAAEAILSIGAFDPRNVLAIDPDILGEHDHEIDPRISCVGITEPGEIDATRFNAWMVQLSQELGCDLLRTKGVLNIAGEARRSVFHGVHMTLVGRLGQVWAPGEPRTNQLAFIGRDLDAAAIREGFAACHADARALSS